MVGVLTNQLSQQLLLDNLCLRDQLHEQLRLDNLGQGHQRHHQERLDNLGGGWGAQAHVLAHNGSGESLEDLLSNLGGILVHQGGALGAQERGHNVAHSGVEESLNLGQSRVGLQLVLGVTNNQGANGAANVAGSASLLLDDNLLLGAAQTDILADDGSGESLEDLLGNLGSVLINESSTLRAQKGRQQMANSGVEKSLNLKKDVRKRGKVWVLWSFT